MADQMAPPEAQGKGASALVVQINDSLNQLGQLLTESQALDPAAMEKFGAIVSGYQDFVQNDLSAPQGEPAPQPADSGVAPVETQGKKAVPAL